jgi:glycosyltransferase involved in cell wall biosynthesis
MRVALITDHPSALAGPQDAYPAEPGAGLGSLATALAGLGAQVTLYAGVPRPADRGQAGPATRPRRSKLSPGAVLEPLSVQAAVPAGRPTGRRGATSRAGTRAAEGATQDRDASDLIAQRIRELADQLAARWQDSPPDVVHAHSWAAGVAALAAGRGLNLPQVQTFYSLAVQDGPSAGARRARLELALARGARAVLVGSSADGSALARLGVPQAAIRVVPPGVDTSLFQPEGPAASRDDRPRLLMVVAGLADDRGPVAALHTLAAVPGAELVIAGGPEAARLARDPGRQALSKLAGQLGVADRVTFTGQITRAGIPDLMRSADVLLNLSPRGPLARVTIEAMACGTPVIAVNTSAHQDAVLDGTTGYLMASTQPAPLARRIRQLLASPLREGMAIAAATRARDRYSWERIGTETLAVYQATVREAHPAAEEPEPAPEPEPAAAGPADEP